MVKNVLKKNEKRRKNNKGFSLVELIVVIAIMAVLVGVLAPQFIKYVEKSRQSTDMQNVQQLKTAVETDIADQELSSGDIKITIDATAKTATVSGITLSSTGSSTVNLKSKTWLASGTREYTYNFTTSKWDIPTGNCINSSAPGKDMDEIFK